MSVLRFTFIITRLNNIVWQSLEWSLEWLIPSTFFRFPISVNCITCIQIRINDCNRQHRTSSCTPNVQGLNQLFGSKNTKAADLLNIMLTSHIFNDGFTERVGLLKIAYFHILQQQRMSKMDRNTLLLEGRQAHTKSAFHPRRAHRYARHDLQGKHHHKSPSHWPLFKI